MSLLSYHQSAKKATSNLECRLFTDFNPPRIFDLVFLKGIYAFEELTRWHQNQYHPQNVS